MKFVAHMELWKGEKIRSFR